MFCPKCGAEMPDGAEFCIKCGTKLPTESTVQQPNTVQADAPTKEKKRKSKLPIIIGAAVLLVVIIIVIVVNSGSRGGRNIDYGPAIPRGFRPGSRIGIANAPGSGRFAIRPAAVSDRPL